MTALFIDIAVIGFIAFCTWRGYKNGLIRGVFGVFSLIVALMISNVAAEAYSKEATSIIMPFASGIVDSALADIQENNITYQPAAHEHDIYDPVFGESYMVYRQIGLPEAAAVTLAKQVMEETFEPEIRFSIVDSLAEKLTNSLSYIAVFAISFLVLSISFAVMGNLLGFVFSLPGLKLLDIISGTAFGLAKGIIIALAFSVVVRYFAIPVLSLLERTTFLNYLVNNNLVANAFGL